MQEAPNRLAWGFFGSETVALHGATVPVRGVPGRGVALKQTEAPSAAMLAAVTTVGFVYRPVVAGSGLAPVNPGGGRGFSGGGL